MIYPYTCESCGDYEVIKSHTECTRPEPCPNCQQIGSRVWTVPQIDTSVCHQDYEFNPGLGCVIKNKAHRKQVAKQMGLEEVGNTKTETLHSMADRTFKENAEKRWADV